MNYEEFLGKADVWSVSEAVDMLVGIRPIVGDPDMDPDRIKRDMRELAYGSIDAKTLPCVGKPKQRRVRPDDFIRWAMSKGQPIPQRMKALLGVEPFPATAAARVSEPEPIKTKPEPPALPSKATPGRKQSEETTYALELLRNGNASSDRDAANQTVDKYHADKHKDVKEGKRKSIERSIRRKRKQ